jgi:uncharacterized metal-binding protein
MLRLSLKRVERVWSRVSDSLQRFTLNKCPKGRPKGHPNHRINLYNWTHRLICWWCCFDGGRPGWPWLKPRPKPHFLITFLICFGFNCDHHFFVSTDHYITQQKKQNWSLFGAIWFSNANFFDSRGIHASQEAKQPPLKHLKTLKF